MRRRLREPPVLFSVVPVMPLFMVLAADTLAVLGSAVLARRRQRARALS